MQYIPQFLDGEEARQLLCWFTSPAVSWQQESFQIFGKTVRAPRQLTFFGDLGVNYRYTGVDHRAEGWPGQLEMIRAKVSEMAELEFNFLLVNRYRHGGEHMGWHRDDERSAHPRIASLSLGATRRFRMRAGPGAESYALDLTAGSLLLLDGRVQHMLAKTRRPVGERINLTFRCIHET